MAPMARRTGSTTNAALNKIPDYTSTDFVAGYRYKLPENFVFGKAVEFKLGVQNPSITARSPTSPATRPA